MSHAFDPNARLVVVQTVLTGPTGTHQFRFAVDTGSTRTAVAGHVLELLGYQEPPAAERRRARTGSGETRAGLVPVARIQALGRVRMNFSSLWLSMPPGVMLDGLLGLDFFRGLVLTLDFARGQILLREPKSWLRFWR
jgi:predicted aspartyl protease